VLHGAPLSGELAEPIRAAGLAVVVPALGVGTPRRALEAVARLAQDGVPFGFGLDAPWNHADGLRFSAVLCVRAGLDRQAAWRALTADAARIAGVDDRLGRIERGLEADLVLWSGDPFDLASRAEIVISNGVAHAAPAAEARR
jgi:imidazolonepropionase-like amidohydrolase